jgi:hypothetical protein
MAEVPMNNDSSSGGRALMRSIWSSGGSDIIIESVDILLDSVLDEGLLRDIPVVGWIAKTYGLVNTVRERLFLKKILLFLRGTQATTAEERRAFAEKMEANPKFQRKVGEDLLLLLDRHECTEKSELLGKVYAGVLRKEISYEEFERYAFIIDRLFLRDLINLARHYSSVTEFEASRKRGDKAVLEQFLDEKTTQALFGNGLLDSDGVTEIIYRRNDLGEKLIRLISPEKDSM